MRYLALAIVLLAGTSLAADKTIDVEKKESLKEGSLTVSAAVKRIDYSNATILQVVLTFENAPDGKRVNLGDWFLRLTRGRMVAAGDAAANADYGVVFLNREGQKVEPTHLSAGQSIRATFGYYYPQAKVSHFHLEIPDPDILDDSIITFKIPAALEPKSPPKAEPKPKAEPRPEPKKPAFFPPEDPAAAAERKARLKLQSAQALLRDGKTERARELLTELVKAWPRTKAAAEARKLLDE